MYKGLYKYLEQCPQLKGKKFNFDFLGSTPVWWKLSIPPNNPLLFKTVTGNTHNKLDFYLVATLNWGNADMNNWDNLEMFQSIKEWFVEQNNSEHYPDLGNGKTPTGVYAQTDGYMESTTPNTGIYQIQCRVEYDQATTTLSKIPDRW